MKRIILSLFSLIAVITATAQIISVQSTTLLASNNGVTLSYKYEFVDTRRCMEVDYDQYLVTGYLENKSPDDIRLMVVNISSEKQNKQVKAPPCGYGGTMANVQFPFYNVLKKNDKITLSYYILVWRGFPLLKPDWQLNYMREKD